MTRVAIYARYSSEHQQEASIEDQVRLCTQLIDQRGWALHQAYTDHAISGATTLRPGYQSLLNDARAGQFDVVVAEGLDRLSRDQETIAGLYKQLTFMGIEIVTVAEGPVSELHIGLKGTMNALFLKDLAIKTHRGLRGRVEAGRSGGGNSFGYDVIAALEGNRGERKINTAEAKTVIRIFADYASGKSPRQIAFDLNSDGIEGPRGKVWGASTIYGNAKRGTGILNNELYVGRLVWNRLRYVKNPTTGKRISRLNPQSEWIIKDQSELRIVDQALWDRVKKRQVNLQKNTRPDLDGAPPFWRKTRPKYLLSGLMKCGQCGGSYTKISKNLFGCATARNKGTCDNRLNIRTEQIETLILDGLKDQLMDPDLFKEFTAAFIDELNRLQILATADADAAPAESEKIDRQIDQLVMAIANGADALPLNDKIKDLVDNKNSLQHKISDVNEPEPLVHPNLADLYHKKISELGLLLLDPEFKQEAMEVIRGLIDEIVLMPEDGTLSISLTGELAGILSLCDRKKKPASSFEERAKQIKMVAGVGFEPTTFRL